MSRAQLAVESAEQDQGFGQDQEFGQVGASTGALHAVLVVHHRHDSREPR